MPGNAEANPLLGSIEVPDSPPKFRVNTESGSGVNFSRLPCKRCFLFLASPTSGMFFHSSSETYDMIWLRKIIFQGLQREINTYCTQFSFEVTKLLLNFWSFLTILFNFFFPSFFSVLSSFFIHAFINGFINCISFLIIFIVGIFVEQRATITSKLIVIGIIEIFFKIFIIILFPFSWCWMTVIWNIICISSRTNIWPSSEACSTARDTKRLYTKLYQLLFYVGFTLCQHRQHILEELVDRENFFVLDSR